MKCLYLIFLSLFSVQAFSTVIYSTCPVASTLEKNQSVDRFKPEEMHTTLRRIGREAPLIGCYVAWLFSGERPSVVCGDAREVKRAGIWLEDLQLTAMMASESDACHSRSHPMTAAQAIFPVAVESTVDGKLQYRVRYRLCDYYVDRDRQLPIENKCSVLGRESGYTFDELKMRYEILRKHVEDTREGLRVSAYAAGAVGTLTSFRALRIMRVAGLPAVGLGVLPAGASVFAVQAGWTDELVRDLVNLQNAAEVAVKGDLTTAVPIDRPMQVFAPYFLRYLESIDLEPSLVSDATADPQ